MLEKHKSVEYNLGEQRFGWMQLIKGELEMTLSKDQQSTSIKLNPGDGLRIDNSTSIEIKSLNESEFLFFDLR